MARWFQSNLSIADRRDILGCDILEGDDFANKLVIRAATPEIAAMVVAWHNEAEEITNLDLAWEAVNALGGTGEQDNSYDQGHVDAIAKALEAIEKLGGEDPLPKRAAPQRAS